MTTTAADDEVRALPGAKPCPFCGGEKIRSYPGSTFRWRYAACDDCGAQCGEVRIETISVPRLQAIDDAQVELLAVWNKRHGEAEQQGPKRPDADYYNEMADGLAMLPTSSSKDAALVSCAVRLIRSLVK